MYKRFPLQDIQSIKNDVIPRMTRILQNEKYQSIKDYYKHGFKEWNTVCYLNRWEPTMRMIKAAPGLHIVDEVEKIELLLDEEQIGNLQSLVKKYMIKPTSIKSTMTIEKILMEECKKWTFNTILDKPYIVYDIETDGDIFDVTQQKFIIAYSAEPGKENKMTYELIEKEWLQKFVQKLLDFDGYIVWFNNIWFDNPVIIHNVWWSQADIDNLNSKSIDIFHFVHHMAGKKISLNKMASALVGVEKTLSSWLEWVQLYKDYIKTGDEEKYTTFKLYCKNDVKMTILLLLYLLYYKRIALEGEEQQFDIQTLVANSCSQSVINNPITPDTQSNASIFE